MSSVQTLFRSLSLSHSNTFTLEMLIILTTVKPFFICINTHDKNSCFCWTHSYGCPRTVSSLMGFVMGRTGPRSGLTLRGQWHVCVILYLMTSFNTWELLGDSDTNSFPSAELTELSFNSLSL